MAEMNIRRRGIHSELDSEGAAELQLCGKVFGAENLGGTPGEKIDIGHVK